MFAGLKMEPNEDPFEVIETEDYKGPNEDRHPANITILSTSTLNPNRPRTLRAGYEYKTATLTVIFRDGTWWNYYNVPVWIWEAFRDAPSKGQFLNSIGLDAWPDMGPASVAGMSASYLSALSSTRYAQIGSKGKQLRKLRGVKGLEAIKRGKSLGQRSFEHEQKAFRPQIP